MAVLLLGNGINRSEGLACSWDDLLKSALKEDTGDIAVTGESPEKVHELPSVAGLTMTLGFDLQEFYAIDHSIAENSTDLKRKIANSIRNTINSKTNEAAFKWENTIHCELMNLPVNTFLTTNYDYALEKSVDSSFKDKKGSDETTYSRNRKHIVNTGAENKTIYHIHGEIQVPKSICLGFEQYSGSLEKMRYDLVRTTKIAKDSSDQHTYHLRDAMMNLKKTNGEDEDDGCWYLKFFKEDIYILGLRFDLSEQDLWWLLDFRIRKKNYEKNDLKITNKIYFFDSDSDGSESKEYAARNILLEAFGVEIIPLSGKNFPEKYQKAVDIMRSMIEK